MEINLLSPHGYCNGVKKALLIVTEALRNPNTKKPIYLLGNIIHNKYVSKKLESLGAITIDTNESRLKMLDYIDKGTVVFSAHGVSDKVRQKAISKGLDIIDATCPNVLFIQKKVKDYLSKGYKIIYIGTQKHPECEAILELSSDIYLYFETLNLSSFKDKFVYVTNQTTLSLLDIENIYNKIKENLPNAIIDNKICNATTKRQLCVLENSADICIVVGDKLSSNSKKLCEVAKRSSNASYLVESVKDLENISFKGINKVNVTSAASTPEELTLSIIDYLKKIEE